MYSGHVDINFGVPSSGTQCVSFVLRKREY